MLDGNTASIDECLVSPSTNLSLKGLSTKLCHAPGGGLPMSLPIVKYVGWRVAKRDQQKVHSFPNPNAELDRDCGCVLRDDDDKKKEGGRSIYLRGKT